MSRFNWLLLPAVGMFTVLASLSACHSPEPDHAAAGDEPVSVDGDTVRLVNSHTASNGLTTAPVTVQDHIVLNLPGRLAWDEDRTVRVFSPLSGRVLEARVQPGDQVKAGATLALISAADFGSAQADFSKAQTAQQFSQKALNRMRDLNAHGIVASKDLEQAESDVANADAELARAQARLKSLGAIRAHTGNDAVPLVNQQYRLISPIDGVVVEKHVNPGQELTIDQSGPALFVVTDPIRLWVRLDAHENDLARLRSGAAFQLKVPAYLEASASGSEREISNPIVGRIDQIADFIDPTTRSVQLRGSVANRDRRMKAEMFITATFSLSDTLEAQSSPTLLVPAEAVFQIGEKQYVFVTSGDAGFRRVPVVAVPNGEGQVRIREGLTAADRVVSQGALFLQQLMAAGSTEHAGSGS